MTRFMSTRYGVFAKAFALVVLVSTSQTGCAGLGGKAAPAIYDLQAPTDFSGLTHGSRAQILVVEPAALKVLDNEQIAVRSQGSVSYLASAQWSDRLTKLVQARLIEGFENSRRAKAVGKPGDRLSVDYQLSTTIRAFDLVTDGGKRARIDISARLLNDRSGKVVASKLFTAEVPADSAEPRQVVAAFNLALKTVLKDMIVWSFRRI